MKPVLRRIRNLNKQYFKTFSYLNTVLNIQQRKPKIFDYKNVLHQLSVSVCNLKYIKEFLIVCFNVSTTVTTIIILFRLQIG